jgi:hypothetical protein
LDLRQQRRGEQRQAHGKGKGILELHKVSF